MVSVQSTYEAAKCNLGKLCCAYDYDKVHVDDAPVAIHMLSTKSGYAPVKQYTWLLHHLCQPDRTATAVCDVQVKQEQNKHRR